MWNVENQCQYIVALNDGVILNHIHNMSALTF